MELWWFFAGMSGRLVMAARRGIRHQNCGAWAGQADAYGGAVIPPSSLDRWYLIRTSRVGRRVLGYRSSGGIDDTGKELLYLAATNSRMWKGRGGGGHVTLAVASSKQVACV